MALGLLLLVLGFCLAVDTPGSATVAGRTYACGDVIGVDLLVSGQSTQAALPDERTAAERRLDASVDAACGPVARVGRWAVWGGIGLGGLALLTGWTAVREREHDAAVRSGHLTPV